MLTILGLGLLIAGPAFARQQPGRRAPTGKPADAAPQDALADESEHWIEIENWILEHPTEYAEAIKRLQALLPNVSTDALKEEIGSRIMELRTAMAEASDQKSARDRRGEAARAVAEVLKRIKSMPDRSRDNVLLLEALLPIVEGTPYENLVWQQLESENERDRFESASEAAPAEGEEGQTIRSPSPSGFGFRAGFGDYLYSTDHPLYLRSSLGLYYYFAGKEASRLEGGLDYSPSRTEPSRNRYVVLRLDYVKYSPGSFYLAAGGGLIFEQLYGDDGTFGCVDAAIGNRLALGNKELDLRLNLQVPVGQNLNAPWLLSLAFGYDL